MNPDLGAVRGAGSFLTGSGDERGLDTSRCRMSAVTVSSEVIVALLAAAASLVVAGLTAWRTGVNDRRLFNLEQGARRDELAHTAKAELDQYREPLLRAALDLASRIDNIRNKNYLDKYLSDEGRRSEIARISSFYRFARYWSVVEALYGSVALVRFEQDEQTKDVAGMLRKIGRAFATDDYGPCFMMWRDEQRAVAELMHRSPEAPEPIGFAMFFDRYAEVFEPWFGSFSDDLGPASARKSKRFRVLQRELALLAKQLDTGGTYRSQCDKLIRAAD